jgi:hypothetical protein
MACKFKYGDKVKAGGHDGKVISISKEDYGYTCTVKFDNRFLIPPKMDYKESELEMVEAAPESSVKCTCGIEATYGKIPVENHKYYCDLVKEKERLENKKKEDDDDLLKQFEIMLGTDDDDDDDFGFYIP